MFQQYSLFIKDFYQWSEVLDRLRIKGEAQKFLALTHENWTSLINRWSRMTSRTRVWRWKLDSNLPGRLGHIGDWLYRAEELLENEEYYVDSADQTARNIRRKLDEHLVTRILPLSMLVLMVVLINCDTDLILFNFELEFMN